MSHLDTIGEELHVKELSKKRRAFTEEQIEALSPFIKEGKKATVHDLKPFCDKWGTTFSKVWSKIYSERNKLTQIGKEKRPYVRKVKTIEGKSKEVIFGSNSGEFEIPIKKWKIAQKESGEIVLKISI